MTITIAHLIGMLIATIIIFAVPATIIIINNRSERRDREMWAKIRGVNTNSRSHEILY